jgi:hypothetical protein
MLKCHFIVMASNELTSVREVIVSAEERPWSYYLRWGRPWSYYLRCWAAVK